MFSNTLPAAVEIQMGVLEDRTLQRADRLASRGKRPRRRPNGSICSNQAGKVHLFRQRVTIPNVDPSAYQ